MFVGLVLNFLVYQFCHIFDLLKCNGTKKTEEILAKLSPRVFISDDEDEIVDKKLFSEFLFKIHPEIF